MSENETIGGSERLDTNVADLGYVAVKTVGLWVLAISVQSAAQGAGVLWSIVDDRFANLANLSPWVIPPAVYLILGVGLLTFARPLSARIFRVQSTIRVSGTATGFVALAAVALGLWWLTFAVTRFGTTFVKWVIRYREMHADSVPAPGSTPPFESLQDVYVPAVYLVIGAFLFFRPSWIVGQWKKRVQLPVAE
ncbi:MAG: hypothetical protein ACTHM6_08195 [Tepidisphaeraceae bacterium]